LVTSNVEEMLATDPHWFAWGEAYGRQPPIASFHAFEIAQAVLFFEACLGYRNLGLPGITPVGIWVSEFLGSDARPQFFDFRIRPSLHDTLLSGALPQTKARARGTWRPTNEGPANKIRLRIPHA